MNNNSQNVGDKIKLFFKDPKKVKIFVIIVVIVIIVVGIGIFLIINFTKKTSPCSSGQIYDQKIKACREECSKLQVYNYTTKKCSVCPTGTKYETKDGNDCCVPVDKPCPKGTKYDFGLCACRGIWEDVNCQPCLNKEGICCEGDEINNKQCGVASDNTEFCNYDVDPSYRKGTADWEKDSELCKTMLSIKDSKGNKKYTKCDYESVMDYFCTYSNEAKKYNFQGYDPTTLNCKQCEQCCKNPYTGLVGPCEGCHPDLPNNTSCPNLITQNNKDPYTCQNPTDDDYENACLYDKDGCSYGYSYNNSSKMCEKSGSTSMTPKSIKYSCGDNNCKLTTTTGGCRPSTDNWIYYAGACYDATVKSDLTTTINSVSPTILNLTMQFPLQSGETSCPSGDNFRYAVGLIDTKTPSISWIQQGGIFGKCSELSNIVSIDGHIAFNTPYLAEGSYFLVGYGLTNDSSGTTRISHVSKSTTSESWCKENDCKGVSFVVSSGPSSTTNLDYTKINIEQDYSNFVAQQKQDIILKRLNPSSTIPSGLPSSFIPIANENYTICPNVGNSTFKPSEENMALVLSWEEKPATDYLMSKVIFSFKNPTVCYYLVRVPDDLSKSIILVDGNENSNCEPSILPVPTPLQKQPILYSDNKTKIYYYIDADGLIIDTNWLYSFGVYVRESDDTKTCWNNAAYKTDLIPINVYIPEYNAELCWTIDYPNGKPTHLVINTTDPTVTNKYCVAPEVVGSSSLENADWYCTYEDSGASDGKIRMYDSTKGECIDISDSSGDWSVNIQYKDTGGGTGLSESLNPYTKFSSTPTVQHNDCSDGLSVERQATCGCVCIDNDTKSQCTSTSENIKWNCPSDGTYNYPATNDSGYITTNAIDASQGGIGTFSQFVPKNDISGQPVTGGAAGQSEIKPIMPVTDCPPNDSNTWGKSTEGGSNCDDNYVLGCSSTYDAGARGTAGGWSLSDNNYTSDIVWFPETGDKVQPGQTMTPAELCCQQQGDTNATWAMTNQKGVCTCTSGFTGDYCIPPKPTTWQAKDGACTNVKCIVGAGTSPGTSSGSMCFEDSDSCTKYASCIDGKTDDCPLFTCKSGEITKGWCSSSNTGTGPADANCFDASNYKDSSSPYYLTDDNACLDNSFPKIKYKSGWSNFYPIINQSPGGINGAAQISQDSKDSCTTYFTDDDTWGIMPGVTYDGTDDVHLYDSFCFKGDNMTNSSFLQCGIGGACGTIGAEKSGFCAAGEGAYLDPDNCHTYNAGGDDYGKFVFDTVKRNDDYCKYSEDPNSCGYGSTSSNEKTALRLGDTFNLQSDENNEFISNNYLSKYKNTPGGVVLSSDRNNSTRMQFGS